MDMVQRPPARTRADHQLKKAWSLRTRVFPLHFYPRRDGGRRAGTPRRSAHTANPDRVACCWCEVGPKYPGPWSWAPGRGRRGDPSTRRIVMRGREPRGASAVQRSCGGRSAREPSYSMLYEGARTVRGESVACTSRRNGNGFSVSASRKDRVHNAVGERWKDSAGAIDATRHLGDGNVARRRYTAVRGRHEICFCRKAY